MKHTKPYGAFLLSLLLLCACAENSSDAASPDAVQVAETIRVSVVPMEALGAVATRSEEEIESKALQVNYTSAKATRADIDKTAKEKEIKSAYVVQFNGTAAGSTATWVSGNVATNLNSGSPVNCSFMLTAGVKHRVYVVANPKSAPTLNMTLQAFETVAYTVASALPATGLPMAAFQDVALGESLDLFQLKSPLARLTFTSTGTLTLRGIPSAYSLAIGTAGATAVRPSGVTYTNTATLTSGTSYYVPANLSGQVSLSLPIFRCSLFAPANSMYVVISANSTTYNIYLGDSTPSDFNVVGNSAYAVTATLIGNNGATDYRVGTPTNVDLSKLGTAIDLSASGTANCYIATQPNKLYSFNAKVMGNGAKTPANGAANAADIVPTALNPVSTDVLWETWNTATAPTKGSVLLLVSYANDKIYVYTGSQQGNAVIAARDASNSIIWSWHIWRINTDPTLAANRVTTTSYTSTAGTFDDTNSTTHPGFTMMKLNLGALSSTAGDDLSTGFHYQWGRKDPFPAYAGLTAPNNVVMATVPAGIPVIPSAEAQYTVAQSIAQPTTYLRKAGDWCSTRNDNLWGTPLTNKVISSSYNSNKGSKSIYDPCPVGWRVPPAYVYANATHANSPWDTTNNTGRDFKGIFNGTSVWFPASGYRGSSSGTLSYVGSFGDYWVSTPNASNPPSGHNLHFSSGSVDPNGGSKRAVGYSCRCVLE